jgi:L-ascorbate metabolism protein UlaG (beta-lactamase superfamily)
MSWRNVVDSTKRSQLLLRVADRLGRGRGRLRVLDRLNPPPPAPLVPDLSGWADHQLAAAWLGHATVLLRVGGKTILTDPVLFNRVGLGLGLMTGGPRRLVAAAVAIERLPPLDLILISHAHFDHLDRPTLGRLDKSVPVITAGHTADLIADLGYKSVTELKWGESTEVGPLKLTAHTVAHWGARTFHDRHRGYNAYVIDAAGRRVLYGGDTAYFDGFKEVAPVDLAILGIGAYDPYIAAHATPEQAAEMARQAGAKWLLPIHHSTFRLSHEPTREPIERLVKAFDAERVVARDVGQVWVEPQA